MGIVFLARRVLHLSLCQMGCGMSVSGFFLEFVLGFCLVKTARNAARFSLFVFREVIVFLIVYFVKFSLA